MGKREKTWGELVQSAVQNVQNGIEAVPDPTHDKEQACESCMTALFSGHIEKWLKTVEQQRKEKK